jgi:hypothetical protein
MSERQSHGKIYQNWQIKRFGLEDTGYTAKFDAYDSTMPWSIKTSSSTSIELADMARNARIDEVFMLNVGFHKSKIVKHELYCFIPPALWKSLMAPNSEELVARWREEFENIPSDRSFNQEWKRIRKRWVAEYGDHIIRPRFKRDSKEQRRIQCAINLKDLRKYILPNCKHYFIMLPCPINISPPDTNKKAA